MSVEDSWFTVDRATGNKVKTKRHGRGKRWRVRNRGAQTVSFVKRSDADAHDTKVKSELLRGLRPADEKAGRILFGDYADQWFAGRYANESSATTLGGFLRNHIKPEFKSRTLAGIANDPESINRWKAKLSRTRSRVTKQPLSPKTQLTIFVMFSSIMNSAVRERRISVNPCTHVDAPTVPKRPKTLAWPAERARGLINAMPDREHALGLLGAKAGLRQGEAFAVSVADIDPIRRRLSINHQVQRVGGKLTLVPPKWESYRTVPLDAETVQALTVHQQRYPTVAVPCQCCPGTTHRLLFHDGGRPWDHQNWNEGVWWPALRANGVEPAGPVTGFHQLRHHYVSTLVDGGASILDVRDLVGHRSVVTTEQVYGHLFEHSHDKIRAILDGARGAGVYPLRTEDAG